MASELTKKKVERKIKHHSKKLDFYNKKLTEIESKSKRIGFKHYD